MNRPPNPQMRASKIPKLLLLEKRNRKPGISKRWQNIESKFRIYQTSAAKMEISKVQLSKI